MKLIIKTVYENVDDEWLKWWTDRLEAEGGLPEASRELLSKGTASFSSKDPTSEVTASTIYEVVK